MNTATLDDVDQKACCRCGELWPRDKEFFHGDRNSADGLACTCKACVDETRQRQVARTAQDPRLHTLRQELRAGRLRSVRVRDVMALFRSQGTPAPDGRVVARMLKLLADENLVAREGTDRKRRYRLITAVE